MISKALLLVQTMQISNPDGLPITAITNYHKLSHLKFIS